MGGTWGGGVEGRVEGEGGRDGLKLGEVACFLARTGGEYVL